jgi:Zn-dependent M28 family amino/carboxypeptidase
VSWGIDVPAGRTWNVVATPPNLRLTRSHLLVGAHLDTVPQAPGAEDNASGVAVVLELARLTADQGSGLPVVFVAFGGEEPRGSGDNLHHFGSTAMVEQMSAAQRRGLVGMVALDRVGVGTSVPVCTGGLGPRTVQTALLRTARRDRIPVQSCVNALRDHWSFEKAGIAAARVGGTPYAAYHSAADVPSVVNRAQLRRSGQLLWDWLRR